MFQFTIVRTQASTGRATLTILRAEGRKTELHIEDLAGKTVHRREWVHSAG